MIKNFYDNINDYWLNLQNMIFSERGTAEYRLHGATMNSQKMINWLFIVNAICKYAEDNVQEILKTDGNIKFANILNYYRTKYPNDERAAFLSDYVSAYYSERCKIFEKDMKKDDRLSEHELKSDKKYVFTYQGVGSLV